MTKRDPDKGGGEQDKGDPRDAAEENYEAHKDANSGNKPNGNQSGGTGVQN